MPRKPINKDAELLASLAVMETGDLERLVDVGRAILLRRRQKTAPTTKRAKKVTSDAPAGPDPAR